jgi:hypothetical protein
MPNKSGTLLEALVSFYGNLTLDVLDAMRSTRQDIRTGHFKFDKALGKAINVCIDATEGWLSAVLVTASHPLPTAYLRAGDGTNTVSAEVSVLVQVQPQWTDLFQVGGEGRVRGADIKVDILTKGDGLVVALPGFAELRDKYRLEAGLYQGLIYTGDKPLAIIMLFYDPSYKEGTARPSSYRA